MAAGFVAMVKRVDSSTQLDQSQHLQQLALDELELSKRQLADAGRTIDELRSDALALATRVDGARAEAESFREKLEQERQQVEQVLRQGIELQQGQDALRATITDLETHVTRLKRQLERPGRLVAKKVLRRGPYSSPDAP